MKRGARADAGSIADPVLSPSAPPRRPSRTETTVSPHAPLCPCVDAFIVLPLWRRDVTLPSSHQETGSYVNDNADQSSDANRARASGDTGEIRVSDARGADGLFAGFGDSAASAALGRQFLSALSAQPAAGGDDWGVPRHGVPFERQLDDACRIGEIVEQSGLRGRGVVPGPMRSRRGGVRDGTQ